jgi:hypothetical protein
MPGLLRGVARTAAVAGTATAVSNRVSRRQGQRWAEQNAPPEQEAYAEEPPPAPVAEAPPVDPIQRLTELADLKDRGILTDAEFALEKSRILGR